jgi:D-glycero-alpha-D-manno-heptose 1-phosphate guanylyltransferase
MHCVRWSNAGCTRQKRRSPPDAVQAIVLAGGFGTRLRARVSDVPKPMAPIAGRPFLEYVLDRLDSAGCQRVVLATGYLSAVIEAHFGSSYRSMSVAYSVETTPLGTGGAVLKALLQMPDEPTLVMNGDTWLDMDPAGFVAWARARAPADAVLLRRVDDVSRFGCVELDGERITRFGEKSASGPGLINAGFYWLHRASFSRWAFPETFSLENDFFQAHLAELDLRGTITEGAFIDIGVPAEYDRAQVEIPQAARA